MPSKFDYTLHGVRAARLGLGQHGLAAEARPFWIITYLSGLEHVYLRSWIQTQPVSHAKHVARLVRIVCPARPIREESFKASGCHLMKWGAKEDEKRDRERGQRGEGKGEKAREGRRGRGVRRGSLFPSIK